VLGRLRDGELTPTPAVMGGVFAAVDSVKSILEGLAASQAEPAGDDGEVIERLGRIAAGAASVVEHPSAVARASRMPKPLVPAIPAAAPTPASPRHSGADTSRSPGVQARRRPTAQAGTASGTNEPGSAEAVAAQTLRVRVDLLEQLMNLVGELVLTRNQLLQLARSSEVSGLKSPMQRLSHITSELQESVMRTRMQPIGSAWGKLPRLVRDLGFELGKRIELRLEGADTELDRQVLELIKDPLTHMIRNSADHGLETPDERRAAGKPEQGVVRLEAFHEGGHIIVRIGDDGRGLDVERIRAKALANRLATEQELASMPSERVLQFIFRAGFSTAEQVSSVSGRGVGMDVVRTNIERIGGSIELASERGRGTTFTIKIPLTLAIVSVLIVGAGGQRFAIPQLGVAELVRAGDGAEHRIEVIDGAPILRLRDRLLPLVSLARVLGLPAEPPRPDRPAYVVVVRVGALCLGLLVDRVFDTEEIVVKPLAPILRHARLFSGNTILGDGGVVMILDLNAVVGAVSGPGAAKAEVADEEGQQQPTESTTLLLFRAGSQAPRAVPLALVTRLEQIAPGTVEVSGGRTVIQYRDQLMPVVDIAGAPIDASESRPRPVLVFTDVGRNMGLAVDEIIDIAEAGVRLDLKSDGPASLGSAIIRGRTTEFLDVAHFVRQVFGGWFLDEEKEPFGGDSAGESRRVLLVDDSAFFRNLLTPVLENNGYRVTAAAGPEQALRMRDGGELFDIIVSDIEVPGMDGFGFAAAAGRAAGSGSVDLIPVASSATGAVGAPASTGYRHEQLLAARGSQVAGLCSGRHPKLDPTAGVDADTRRASGVAMRVRPVWRGIAGPSSKWPLGTRVPTRRTTVLVRR
jgi:two-component system chemotaxis sensor kinase CheA